MRSDIFCDLEVVVTYDQQSQTVNLKEEETKQSILIGGIPLDSILIKLDVDKAGYKKRSNYFRNGTAFIHKGCDYALIIPSMSLIVLFELKSKKPKETDYVNQFLAAEFFIDYCNRLSSHINCSLKNYNYRRILLSPKYNNTFTAFNRIMDISTIDKCGNEIEIKTPGFPPRIRLEKLVS